MGETYSTYEAKARFSEILRKVRAGGRVTISYRGEQVAEVQPIGRGQSGLRRTLTRLEESGVVGSPPTRRSALKSIARRPGALARFLESRD